MLSVLKLDSFVDMPLIVIPVDIHCSVTSQFSKQF